MAPALSKSIPDLDIQQWVQEHFGFVPHPYWIHHCRELFLTGAEPVAEDRRPWHECPLDKREGIRQAFLHFRLLAE
jgi:hypothetical protein